MLLARCLLLSCTVLQAPFILCRTEPFRFVDTGSTARILCPSTRSTHSGIVFGWYKRRENEILALVKDCDDTKDSSTGKFVCRAEQQGLILEISHVKREDSGTYLCAKHYPGPFNSTRESSLIVGDSFTPSTRVMLLLPPPHLAHAGHVACVVLGVSNLVQVSWEVHGGLQQEGLTLMVGNRSGLLTFASVLWIPRDQPGGGKNITCKVRFNSSGPGVKESATFPPAVSTDSKGKCLSHVVPTVVVGLLAVLTLLLTLLWIRCCPSRNGFQLKVDEAPSSEVPEEGICYAQLDFPSKSCDRKDKRNNRDHEGEIARPE
ncbi:uncharacterized protein LOC143828618 [Paroedura picta]|uniref:uncharacterized protein LOC143828618 n=1 Tax=Paroedura picta TaxID=143630 RepID=UPI004055D2D2